MSFASSALADISFSTSSNSSLTLHETLTSDDNSKVFVFKGLADGDAAEISFSTDTDCPYIAMTGGASFSTPWTCTGGVISTSVIYKGGMSFGPATDENAGSFYVTFNTPPAPPGYSSAPTEFKGIQIAIYGDVSHWGLSGDTTENGVSFGVELTGSQGGEAHFLMDLPEAAVTFLGGVLGVSVGGKPNPFATVTTNEDGSVSVRVDIAKLDTSSVQSARIKASKTVTKKITAGARVLGIASKVGSIKAGKSLSLAMCAGATFTSGDKIPVKFTVGGKANSSLKASSFKLDDKGCATTKLKLPSSISGSLVSSISYNGKKAKTTTKIIK